MNEQLPVQLSFDVSLPERAQRIRDLVGVARTCIIEIGRELIAAKAEVAHGGWLDWLKDEFGWHQTTASRYMQVAEAFKLSSVHSFDGLTIDATALYALSAPDVPQEARDEPPRTTCWWLANSQALRISPARPSAGYGAGDDLPGADSNKGR